MDGKQVAVLAPTTVLAFQHLEDAARALRRIPRAHRHGQPVPHESRAEGHARGCGGRQGRSARRHASAAVERRRVPRPRPAGRGRRATLRRHAQGEDQAAAQARGRPDADGDADSTHAEHVAGRHPRHVHHRDAAEGSAVHPDPRREVRRRGHPARRASRARARRPGVRRPQSRGVDLLARQPGHAARAGSQGGRRPRPDGRRAARTDHARLRGAQVRRARRHHHRRKRAGHPEREHHRDQPRGPLRPGAAVPTARPRRAIRPAGLRLSC